MINGQMQYEFFQLEVFNILYRELGFTSIKINGRNKLLERVPEGYKFVSIHILKDSFREYLENDFDLSTLPEEVNHVDLFNMFFKEKPITRSYANAFFHSKDKLNPNDYQIKGEFLVLK
ncbi:hypothetical protein [Flavobacterium sp. ASW18X]|uniref:hypothetical protein n=1 Tax=Flavobacterium sp. ASW18X TaxID=2572595 RepID=UPI0010AE105D|nr:hypothetical protein [Flavobacterium sp. ASW18X]TKD65158.1 hypothetical protein FBT53_06420 [Flavobacterium sp. ASW18X]